MRHLLALVLSLSICNADLVRFEITGLLDNWENIGLYDTPPLVSPVPFSMVFWSRTELVDQDPANPGKGVYIDPSAPVEVTLGSYQVFGLGTKVEVYAGEGDLRGFFFSNLADITANGMIYPAGRIFAFDVTAFSNTDVAPTDAFIWTIVNQDSEDLDTNEHAHVGSVKNGLVVDGAADEIINSYTATVIPEINQSLLCALGVVTCIGLRRTR